MSITHLAAIGSLLSALLLLAACQGVEVKPASRGGSSLGAGSSGHD
ncbi:hypothetical protein [Inquilinus sp. CA228]